MINPLLNFNKVLIEQDERYLIATFHEKTMVKIKYFLRNKNTYVMALIIFYENNGIKPKKVYRVLSYVLYYIIENYVYIDYLLQQ